jgi:hypothetical protein
MRWVFKSGKRLVAVIVLIFATLAGAAMVLDSWQCRADWVDSGMATRWGPMIGCQIETSRGKWIPAKAYRGVSQ